MSDYPARKEKDELIERDDAEVTPARRQDLERTVSPFGFFSFRYSYREISNRGGRIHLRSKERRYENGRLESEEFEGTMERGPSFYELHNEIQKRFLQQMNSLLKSLPFFAFSPWKDRDK